MFVETKREGEAAQIEPTIRGLIAWLETQPAERHYVFSDPYACALGQYYRSIGQEPRKYVDIQAKRMGVSENCLTFVLASEPRTFGAALERARKVAE